MRPNTASSETLSSCRLINFKAIRDSGAIRLSPLTVFIGNNGSGKSSIIEGLRTLKVMGTNGVDAGMRLWRGVEHAYHRAPKPPEDLGELLSSSKKWGMSFQVRGKVRGKRSAFRLDLIPTANRDFVQRAAEWRDGQQGSLVEFGEDWNQGRRAETGLDFLAPVESVGFNPRNWQFLNLEPQRMMPPVSRQATQGRVELAEDGRNIAEYLDEIRNWKDGGAAAYAAIIETLRFVVPYMTSIRSETASIVEKTLYLSLVEPGLLAHDRSAPRERSQIPGWMMSTGTLRATALIAALHHPAGPSIIVIEEVEDSLDPRTLGLVLAEIREVVSRRQRQVILTTHSPQVLDRVKLEEVILTRRDDRGEPRFKRAVAYDQVKAWAVEFGLGEMLQRDLFRQLT